LLDPAQASVKPQARPNFWTYSVALSLRFSGQPLPAGRTGICHPKAGLLQLTGGEVMARHSLIPAGSDLMGGDPFLSLQRRMNRLFDDMFRTGMPTAVSGGEEGGMVMPQMNVSETDSEIRITAELPGVSEKDVDITLDDDMLTIRGEKRMEKKSDKENYHVVERSFGQFRRTLRVPHSIDPDQVQASVENGVLTVILSKHQGQEKMRYIQVKGGGAH